MMRGQHSETYRVVELHGEETIGFKDNIVRTLSE